MIDVVQFIQGLNNAGIKFITGVPDSLLKELCKSFQSRFTSSTHIIAVNEGAAIGLATGHFLATGRPAMVYMQNSGIGNAVNPLVSIADPLVASIPMVLLVGWRGEILEDGKQIEDEPQHVKQGQITVELFKTLGIPIEIIDGSVKNISNVLNKCVQLALKRQGPVIILARKNTFAKSPDEIVTTSHKIGMPTREESIERILDCIGDNHIPIVCTTGMASRELYEVRERKAALHQDDFLMVGGMGHASQVAAGIALSIPEKKVICIDGDGALLMHAGGLSTTADCKNIIHILINNGAHDSVGGQPTKGYGLCFSEVAKNFGYGTVKTVETLGGISNALLVMIEGKESAFLEIICRGGARMNLGRPSHSPIENKNIFSKFIRV